MSDEDEDDESCQTYRYKKEKQLMTEENVKVIKKKDDTCHLSEVCNDEIYDKLKLDIL